MTNNEVGTIEQRSNLVEKQQFAGFSEVGKIETPGDVAVPVKTEDSSASAFTQANFEEKVTPVVHNDEKTHITSYSGLFDGTVDATDGKFWQEGFSNPQELYKKKLA